MYRFSYAGRYTTSTTESQLIRVWRQTVVAIAATTASLPSFFLMILKSPGRVTSEYL